MLFLIGFGLAQLAVLGTALVASRMHGDSAPDAGGLLLTVVAAPMMMATSVALLVQAFTPRRLFDGRTRRPLKRFVLGAGAALAGTIPASLALVFVNESVHEVLALAGCAAVATAAFLLPLSRRRAGHCVYCEYDLGATPVELPCPECGRADGR